MSIAKLKKLTLIGDAEQQNRILDKLQSLGAVHLIPLQDTVIDAAPDAADDVKDALKYLVNAPSKRRLQYPLDTTPLLDVVEKVIDNMVARDEVVDYLEVLRIRNKALTPWGDFELPALDSVDNYRLWFYCVPLSKKGLIQQLDLPWKIVNKDHKFIYLVVVSETEPDSDKVPFSRTHTGHQSITQLAESRENALVRLEDLNAERESLTRWLLPLQESLNESLNKRELHAAEQQILEAGECFVVQAWMPADVEPILEQWIETVSAAYRLEAPGADELPPTLLENDDRTGGGEEAIAFFQLPGYRTWDPSVLVFCSFSLFFAMIMADAGYALVLGAILFLVWRKSSNLDQTQTRLRNMGRSLVGASVVYGVLVGSYFGVTPPPDNFLHYFHLLNINDFSGMMKISIGAGVLHLVIANAMVAWSSRGSLVALSAVGWVMIIGSAFALWLVYLGTDNASLTHSPAFFSMVLGVVLVLLFSGERKIKSGKDAFLQLFDGLAALYGLSKAFGDVLSYMRLFALGLSSASLAITFNQIAVDARDSVSSGGFILFALIIILGHSLNFVLAIMSGVIHGLRLNLLEFYNWGIKGEGYPFKAFKKRGESIWNNS